MPPHQRFRSDNRNDRQDRRKTSIHLDEEPAVVICEPSPAFQLTPRDDQLMSEHHILRLKPALRLERRGQHGVCTENPIRACCAKNRLNWSDDRADLASSGRPGLGIQVEVAA